MDLGVKINLSNNYPKYLLSIDFAKKVEYQITVLKHDCSLMFKKLMRELITDEEDENEDEIEEAVFGKR